MAKCLGLAMVAVLSCLLLVCFPFEAQRPRTEIFWDNQQSRLEDNWGDGIWIFSPTNTTYNQDTLLLNVTAKRYINPTYYDTQLKYSINGGENTSIFTTPVFVQKPPSGILGDIASYTLFSGTSILPKLPQGTYNLTVYADYIRKEGVDPKWPNMHDIQSIIFTINNGIPPTITLLPYTATLENGYDNFTLNYVVDKPVNWIGYSFDGQNNVTIEGNFTLTKLTYGLHNVTVYAKDQLGNVGTSETAHFNAIDPEQTQPWPFGVVGVVAVVAFLVGVFSISYRKSRFCKRHL